MSPSRRRPRRLSPTGVTLSGPRVVLRPLTENDLKAASWLDQALLGSDGDPVAISRDRNLVGVLRYDVGVPQDGWLSFHFVAVEARLRGLELDSEAVRLMEDDALRRGLAARFWAGVSLLAQVGLPTGAPR